MSAADLHHRTQDFRSVYRRAIEDLHYFMGTQNGIALFAPSGSGAMAAAVAQKASAKAEWEVFSRLKLAEGGPLDKYYPLSEEANREYQAWLQNKS